MVADSSPGELRNNFESGDRPARGPRLLPKDLGVVSFYVKNSQDPYVKHWQTTLDLPTADTCFRNVVYGPREEIEKLQLPETEMSADPDYYYGGEAYSFLLRLLSGLESRRQTDDHLVRQFKQGWEKFKAIKVNAAMVARMEDLASTRLIGDKRHVDIFTDGINKQNSENAAKILAGHKVGHRVMIIGHEHNGEISPVTMSLARILSNRDTSVSQISVAHPVAQVRSNIIDAFKELQRNGKIEAGVMFYSVDAEEFPHVFEDCEAVYCDLPMENDIDFDRQIIDGWKQQFRNSNKLIHLKGSTQREGAISPLFEKAARDMPNIITPHEVEEKVASLGETNRLRRAYARDMIAYITECRMDGKNPDRKDPRYQAMIANFQVALIESYAPKNAPDITP